MGEEGEGDLVIYTLKGLPQEEADHWRVERHPTEGGGPPHKGPAGEKDLFRLEVRVLGDQGRRRRQSVWDKRSHVHGLIEAVGVETVMPHLPIVLRIGPQQAESEAQRGGLSRLIQRELDFVARRCGLTERPGSSYMRKRYGVVSWMGKALCANESADEADRYFEDGDEGATGHVDQGRQRQEKKEAGEEDDEDEEEGAGSQGRARKRAKQLRRVKVATPTRLMLQGDLVGAPLGLSVLDDVKDMGRPIEIGCRILRPGTGRLVVTGNVSQSTVSSAELALAFLRVHKHEIAREFGPWRALQPGATDADVVVHLCLGNNAKSGSSLGAALTVALAALHLGLKVVPYVAVTGQASLCGMVGAVTGLREKIGAAFDWWAHELARAQHITVLVSSDNVRHRSRSLFQQTDLTRGHLAEVIRLEASVHRAIKVMEVRTLLDALRLCLVTAPPAPAPPPNRSDGGLQVAVVPALRLDCQEGHSGGLQQVAECAISRPGTGAIRVLGEASAGEREGIQAAHLYIKEEWEAIKHAWGRPTVVDPSACDMLVSCPGPLRDTRISLAAAVGMLQLFLGCPLPSHAAFLGEVQVDGRIIQEPLWSELSFLELAKQNDRTLLVLCARAATPVGAALQKRPKVSAGVRTVPVRTVMDVVRDVLIPAKEEEHTLAALARGGGGGDGGEGGGIGRAGASSER